MALQVKDANGVTQTVNTLPPNGQANSANSSPVVIASDQSAVPVALAALPALPAGANSIGSVGVNNKPVGAGSLVTAQVSVGITATLLAAARTGAPGVGRIAITFVNSGTATVFYGPAGVTVANGMPLPAGSSATLEMTAALYAIGASGTNVIAVQETF